MPLLFIIIISLFFATLSVFAPGNSVRTELYYSGQLIYSLKWTLVFTFDFAINLITNKLIIIFTILILPLCSKLSELIIKRKNRLFFISPYFTILIIFLLFLALFFPTFWAMGDKPPPRTLVTHYFYGILMWFFLLLNIVVYLKKKHNCQIAKLPNYLYILILIMIPFFLVGDNEKNNIRKAYIDIFNGFSYKYNKELNERHKYIKKSNCKTCIVKPIKNKKSFLFKYDGFNDPKHFFNLWMSSYYQIDKLIVSEE